MRNRLMLSLTVLLATAGSAFAADIPVGHLTALTGPTSDVGIHYSQGVNDALGYINQKGGIAGSKINFETVDYGYKAPQAIATYASWMSGFKPVAIQGWGTADTEALKEKVAQDQVVYISAGYSNHLTDPTGKGVKSKGAAPYNFFYSPSYSDACRGLVKWAADDWKAKKGVGKPKFVHMGDNHPYPNAPKDACGDYAIELGFDIVPAIVYSMKPADAKAQCLSLKDSGANYAYLGNTSGPNISLLKSCTTVGVKTQFLANIWGWDEDAIKATGAEGDGVAWVVGATPWNDGASANAAMKAISAVSDPTGKAYRSLHYIRGACSTMLMGDAMKAAAAKGPVTGPTIKAALESMKNYVPTGLEGVCTPSTWTADDHRSTTQVSVYTSAFNGGNFTMKKQGTVDVPRRPEWLGW